MSLGVWREVDWGFRRVIEVVAECEGRLVSCGIGMEAVGEVVAIAVRLLSVIISVISSVCLQLLQGLVAESLRVHAQRLDGEDELVVRVGYHTTDTN